MDPQALFGPVTTRTHRIDNFDSFILNNVPYGEVHPRNLQWGVLQYDGPGVDGITGAKPALQWHFGGVPYSISKAIRIPYTYISTFDGSNAPTTEQIFLGFQDNLPDFVLPQPIPYVAAPTSTYRARVRDLGPFGAFGNPVWASDPGVLASQAPGIVTRSFQNDPADPNILNAFMQQELSLDQAAFNALVGNPIAIDCDGPAQDSDSHHVFQYTFATLVNDPYKYGQLLFWYFGGKPYRVTKAMRIPLDFDYTPGVEQPSHVLRAVEDAKSKPIGVQARFTELVNAAKILAQKAAAAKAAAAAAKAAPSSSTPGSSPTAQPNPAPQGHALFIGFAGSADPGG